MGALRCACTCRSVIFLLVLQVFCCFVDAQVVPKSLHYLRFDLDEMNTRLDPKEIRPRVSQFNGQMFYEAVSWRGSGSGSDNPNEGRFSEVWNKNTWNSQGRNVFNNRRVEGGNVTSGTLNLTDTPTFEFVLNQSTSATPAIIGNAIIVPSWDGCIRSIHKISGKLLWMVDVGMAYYNATSKGTKIVRTTPAFIQSGDYFIMGTMFPAELLFIRTRDGMLYDKIQIDSHPASVVTISGTVSDNTFFVGISSLEELFADDDDYPCCSFVGSMVAVDTRNGEILWRNYSISENIKGVGKLSGVAYWGSSPAVWAAKNLVFVATGNNYDTPIEYDTCLLDNSIEFCNNLHLGEGEYNYMDSIIGYDMDTGVAKWHKQMTPRDSWNFACYNSYYPGENCPVSPGPDADFGMAPLLDWWCYTEDTIQSSTSPQVTTSEDDSLDVNRLTQLKADLDIDRDSLTRTKINATHNRVCIRALFIGQKNGMLHCLRASNGDIIWSEPVAPSGTLGGMSWGISTDDNNIYASHANSERLPWHLLNGTVTYCGGWIACDKETGLPVWTVVDPACYEPNVAENWRNIMAGGTGPPTVVNDMVLVASKDTIFNTTTSAPMYGGGGWVYALNTTDGSILSSFETKATIVGGFSANDRCVYIGSGYRTEFANSQGTSIFAWCV